MTTNATGVVDSAPPKLDGDGGKPKDIDFVPKGDRDDAIRRRDEALEAKRLADVKVQELSDKLREIEDEKNRKNGDFKSIEESYKTRLTEKDTRIQTLETDLSSSVLKDRMMRTLTEICDTHDGPQKTEDAFRLLQDKIILEKQSDGSLAVRVKDSSLSPKEYAEVTLNQMGRDYLLKSSRKGGTGSQGAGQVNSGGGGKQFTYEQLAAMSTADYAATVKNNPEAARTFARGPK